jgi:hypothetical protein
MTRLRIGILLIILSWLPIAQTAIIIAHDNHHLTSSTAANEFRAIVWGLQFAVGFIGLWLAGKVAMGVVRSDGWKKVPANLWHLFWNGR